MIGAPPRRRRRNSTRPGAPERRVIPFDYAFRFALAGTPGAVGTSSVEVSVEGSFTAVSIGYGVVPQVQPVTFGIMPDSRLAELKQLERQRGQSIPYDTVPLRFLIASIAEKLGESPPVPVSSPELPGATEKDKAAATAAGGLARMLSKGATAGIDRQPGVATALALRSGFRFNPEFAEMLLQADRRELPIEALGRCFQVVSQPPKDVVFKYALFDDGSGREFQSEPILNTAALGAADGGRPFRYFARPIEFGPRSRIRMQITEVSDFQGELHVSLQGFKRLGEAGTPTGRVGK